MNKGAPEVRMWTVATNEGRHTAGSPDEVLRINAQTREALGNPVSITVETRSGDRLLLVVSESREFLASHWDSCGDTSFTTVGDRAAQGVITFDDFGHFTAAPWYHLIDSACFDSVVREFCERQARWSGVAWEID